MNDAQTHLVADVDAAVIQPQDLHSEGCIAQRLIDERCGRAVGYHTVHYAYTFEVEAST